MATGDDVKLLGVQASPFAYRVRIALNIKSVDYQYLEENLGSKSELLLRSNPVHKKIPVLLHNGEPICESLVILQYIDEVWASAPSILPSDPHDRATARFWAAYIDDKMLPVMKEFAAAEGEEAKAAAVARVVAEMALLEETFVKCSKGKGFFGGDSIGYLDIAFGCYVGWIRVIEMLEGVELLGKSKTPTLAEWAERFSCDAAVKDAVPATEKLLEIAKTRRAMPKAAPTS